MCRVLVHAEAKDIIVCDCKVCAGIGWIDDPTACGDPDHCSPMAPCACNPNGLDI